ncbi:tetratricopeptide repeat protein [Nemorincola caseinilytica]|uniref:Tetratricopeptide repeat protein n=2 Tax=Nemorincola caseinilytica TaxID=2054315 RepID=A0ABP8N8N2_9BACT
MGIIALLTFTFYKASLQNLLTNWDDPGYIRDNALIKDLSAQGLKNIFSTAIMGNYHPLTILSYAIEYSFVRLDPWLYHLDNVLLHILVTILVYVFVQKLTGRQVAAGVTALLFGLHPMHVESVAWLSGRKDVLYGTFYVAACIGHLYYRRAHGSGRYKWYAAIIFFFLCSLLAKPVAVTLPVTLMAIDLYAERKWRTSLLLEKLPLLAISIAFGIRSMIDQKAFGSLATQSVEYGPIERLAVGGYALITYLWKAVVPANLSCFYPYPPKTDGVLPAQYYIYIALSLAVLAGLWLVRRNRAVLFGALFFLINIALLLQFIPVGGAILADRYSYIPYLGLFFIAGWYVSVLFERDKGKGKMALAALGTYALVLGIATSARCKDWYDTPTLWRDEIEKQPLAPNAWNNLGFHYFNKFNESVNEAERRLCYDSAYYLLSQAIALDPKFVNPIVSMGELQRGAAKYADAKRYYYTALKLNNTEGTANAYLGLAITYAITQDLDSSGICFRNAIAAKAYFPEVHSNYGNYFDMKGMTDSALVHYGIAISQNPDMYAPWLNRGRLYQRLKRCDEGMKDFEMALSLMPEMGEIYYSRSYCYTQKGNKTAALQDVEKALQLGFRQIDPAYYQMLKTR